MSGESIRWPFLRIAHRGAAGLEPENTLRAVERALSFGVDMVEVDVRRCGDGTLVVVHDDVLQRVAGRHDRVSTLSYGALRNIDVGRGERIPTLEDVLDLTRGRALLNLDQKGDGMARDLLQAIDRAGRRADVMLSGNAPLTFRTVRELAPRMHIALSIDARRRDTMRIMLARSLAPAAQQQARAIIALAHAAQVPGVTLQYHLATAKVVDHCKRAGLHVLCWTVDDLQTMRRLRAAGVQGITSNRPDFLAALQ